MFCFDGLGDENKKASVLKENFLNVSAKNTTLSLMLEVAMRTYFGLVMYIRYNITFRNNAYPVPHNTMHN